MGLECGEIEIITLKKSDDSLCASIDNGPAQSYGGYNTRKAHQHRFNFSKLNAKAKHFHLMIDTTETGKLAIGEAANPVAGAVKAALGKIEKSCDSAYGIVPIARRSLRAGNGKLTGGGVKVRPLSFIEKQGIQAWEGYANGGEAVDT